MNKQEHLVHIDHAMWQGRALLDLGRGTLERDIDGDVLGRGEIISPLSLPGCPDGYLVHWPDKARTEILNLHGDGTAWLYGVGNYLIPHYRTHRPSVVTVCRTGKWFCYRVPKNACSTVMFTAIRQDQGHGNPHAWQHPWDGRAREWNRRQTALPSDLADPDFAHYRHFVIWQDPVERFARYCNYLFTTRKTLSAPYLARRPGDTDSKEQFIARAFKHLACMTDPRNHAPRDEHLERQSFINRVIRRLDDVVRMDDLSAYMASVLGVTPEQSNLSRRREITPADFTACETALLRGIYADDYAWFESVAPKTWRPGL